MLPWFLAYYGTPVGEPLNTRTETVSASQQLGIETLDVLHTAGIHAKAGDRVTVRYKFTMGDKVLADSERLGVLYTFVLGDGTVPDAFEAGVTGLQLKGYRKARVNPVTLGAAFGDRWPVAKESVIFEVTVIGLERPAAP